MNIAVNFTLVENLATSVYPVLASEKRIIYHNCLLIDFTCPHILSITYPSSFNLCIHPDRSKDGTNLFTASHSHSGIMHPILLYLLVI